MRSWRALARRASRSSGNPDPPGCANDTGPADPEVVGSEPDHQPRSPTSAAAASPPTPNRNPRRPGDRAPADGGVASPVRVEGDSWPLPAACRSSLTGLLLQPPRRSDTRHSRLRAGWIGRNPTPAGVLGAQGRAVDGQGAGVGVEGGGHPEGEGG